MCLRSWKADPGYLQDAPRCRPPQNRTSWIRHVATSAGEEFADGKLRRRKKITDRNATAGEGEHEEIRSLPDPFPHPFPQGDAEKASRLDAIVKPFASHGPCNASRMSGVPVISSRQRLPLVLGNCHHPESPLILPRLRRRAR